MIVARIVKRHLFILSSKIETPLITILPSRLHLFYFIFVFLLTSSNVISCRFLHPTPPATSFIMVDTSRLPIKQEKKKLWRGFSCSPFSPSMLPLHLTTPPSSIHSSIRPSPSLITRLCAAVNAHRKPQSLLLFYTHSCVEKKKKKTKTGQLSYNTRYTDPTSPTDLAVRNSPSRTGVW